MLCGAGYFDARHDMGIDAASYVHLDPVMPAFVLTILHIKPADISASGKARSVNREVFLD